MLKGELMLAEYTVRIDSQVLMNLHAQALRADDSIYGDLDLFELLLNCLDLIM